MADGKLSEGILDEAAEFAALGLDPLKFLLTDNTFDLAMQRELFDRVRKKKEILEHNFAAKIANNIAKMMPH